MRLMIIDGNAIVHRAYHALPPLTSPAGVVVNAVYGFASTLLKAWQEIRPTHLAVTFDMSGPTFRHVKFENYKATRVKADQSLYDQIPLVHEVVSAFGLPVYEKSGYEADDCIGTIAKRALEKKDVQVVVVTGDMDTLQLVGPRLKVFTLRKGMTDVVIYDADEVKNKYGFGPELVVDYKALRGDASDNIPGVPGIGEKTATELIQKIGGIKEIYGALRKNQLAAAGFRTGVIAKLKDGEESARMSFELATINTDVPDLGFKLDDCALKDFDREGVIKIFGRFGFNSLIKRVPGVAENIGTPRQAAAKIAPDKFVFEKIDNKTDLEKLFTLVEKHKQFAVEPVAAGEGSPPRLEGWVVAVAGRGFHVTAEMTQDFCRVFQGGDLEIIGHDLKKAVKVLLAVGRQVLAPLFDTMIASYLLAPGSRAHGSAAIILKYLGREAPAGSNQPGLFGVDLSARARELALLIEAAAKLRAELIRTDDLGLFQKMEMPLIGVLAQMELNGVAVDEKLLVELSKRVNGDVAKISKEIYKMADMEFNISSPAQLREVLFDRLEIPVGGIKKGKTGLSTAAEQLEKMRGLHPIIDKIENYRELTKLQNTYIDVLPGLVNRNTGRIHTTFNQAVAATGRLSSSDPNLQNIPIRSKLGREIRRTFIAEEGNTLVSADYSQIELRIVASLAKDERLMEIFAKGEDIHQATAAAINGVPLSEVTPEMRRAAKEVNFGVLYGMGAYGLAWRAEISNFEARDFIKKYFEQFAGVKKYIDRVLEFTKKEGYAETLFGRRRYIPELRSSNFQARSAAERMAVNHPIQGTAADLIKMAMIEINKEIGSQKNKGVKMLLQVHDELVFEVGKGREDKFGEQVKKIMEGVVKLNVPVEVAVRAGRRWGDIK